MRQLTEIQADINMMQQAIQNAGMGVDTSTWQAEKQKYEREYATAATYWAEQATQQQAAEAVQAEREQAQLEKVDSITLPVDFNDLFDNTAANDMVIEVVKTLRLQDYTDHNAEVAKINTDWKTKMQAISEAFTAQLSDLQKRLDAELLQGQEDAKELNDLEQQVSQLSHEKRDAEQKRDNAANELSVATQEIARLNSHIDDLQQQLANAPAPKSAIEIGSSNRLAELVVKAKESAAAAAARGLARWNSTHTDLAVTPLELPTLPQIIEEPAVVATPQVQTAAVGLDGHADTTQVVETVTRAEYEALKVRVDNIERHANIQAVA
jgi:hypothetical protein